MIMDASAIIDGWFSFPIFVFKAQSCRIREEFQIVIRKIKILLCKTILSTRFSLLKMEPIRPKFDINRPVGDLQPMINTLFERLRIRVRPLRTSYSFKNLSISLQCENDSRPSLCCRVKKIVITWDLRQQNSYLCFVFASSAFKRIRSQICDRN